MKLKSMNKETKTFLAVYIGWTFLHLILLFLGMGECEASQKFFFPFSCGGKYSYCGTLISIYDFSEFLVYVGTPAVIFIIYYLTKEKD